MVSAELLKHPFIRETILHTGQHFDENMSDVFFKQLNIPRPEYFLNINQLPHAAMTGRMMEEIEKIIFEIKPDYILVYGDTNSTLAGALAAKKAGIKVIHVEAGLRSFNMKMPEEINRILTDRLSDILFCPSENALENLKKEGFGGFNCQIVKSGDVMYDACKLLKEYAIKPNYKLPSNFALATIHREENTDNIESLTQIFAAFIKISESMPIVLPIHPKVKLLIEKFQINIKSDHLVILPPLSYLEIIFLLNKCRFVLTDSGGLQKEAYFLKKLCLTLRNETEWLELVNQKANIIVGSALENIIRSYNEMEEHIKKANFSTELYGKGDASKIIVDTLLQYHRDGKLIS